MVYSSRSFCEKSAFGPMWLSLDLKSTSIRRTRNKAKLLDEI
jgi:hypothetical protein